MSSGNLQKIVDVYGNVMNRQNVMKWCCHFSEGKTDVHDEQNSVSFSDRPLIFYAPSLRTIFCTLIFRYSFVNCGLRHFGNGV